MSPASHPKTTLQKPKPPSSAASSFGLWMYLPRKMPSTSVIATFTFSDFDARILPSASGSREEAFAMGGRVYWRVGGPTEQQPDRRIRRGQELSLRHSGRCGGWSGVDASGS